MKLNVAKLSDLYLERYIAGDLSASESQQIDNMRRESAELESRILKLKEARAVFLERDPPMNFASRVVAQRAQRRTPRFRLWAWMGAPSLAAALTLMLAVTVSRWTQNGDPQVSPTSPVPTDASPTEHPTAPTTTWNESSKELKDEQPAAAPNETGGTRLKSAQRATAESHRVASTERRFDGPAREAAKSARSQDEVSQPVAERVERKWIISKDDVAGGAGIAAGSGAAVDESEASKPISRAAAPVASAEPQNSKKGRAEEGTTPLRPTDQDFRGEFFDGQVWRRWQGSETGTARLVRFYFAPKESRHVMILGVAPGVTHVYLAGPGGHTSVDIVNRPFVEIRPQWLKGNARQRLFVLWQAEPFAQKHISINDSRTVVDTLTRLDFAGEQTSVVVTAANE